FSRPTPSGTTSFGKTTASRSGTTGRSAGYAMSGAVVFVSSVMLFLCFFRELMTLCDEELVLMRNGVAGLDIPPGHACLRRNWYYYFGFAFVALTLIIL